MSDKVEFNVVEDGKTFKIAGKIGEKLLDSIRNNKIQINDACEGSLGCGTCHVYITEDHFKRLPPTCDKEEDLLQFVPLLRDNSRLSCGVRISEALRGATVQIPSMNRNVLSEHDL